MVKRRKGTAQERLDAAEEDEARWVDKMLRAATRVRKLRAEIARLEPLVEKETEAKHVVLAADHCGSGECEADEGCRCSCAECAACNKCSGCGAESFLQERAGELLCDSCYCLNEHLAQNPNCPKCVADRVTKRTSCPFQDGSATPEDLEKERAELKEKTTDEFVGMVRGFGVNVIEIGGATATKPKRSRKKEPPKVALDMDKGIVNVEKPKKRRSKKNAEPDKREW